LSADYASYQVKQRKIKDNYTVSSSTLDTQLTMDSFENLEGEDSGVELALVDTEAFECR